MIRSLGVWGIQTPFSVFGQMTTMWGDEFPLQHILCQYFMTQHQKCNESEGGRTSGDIMIKTAA